MKRIEDTGLWKSVDAAMKWVIIVSSSIMIVLLFISVILRYCFNSSIFGYDEILTLMAIWMYWLGGAYGSMEDSHISADMTALFIKNKKVLLGYKIIVRALTVIVTAVFAYWGIFDNLIMTINAGTKTMGLHIPMWIPRASFTVGLFLMFLYAIYWLVRDTQKYRNIYIKHTMAEEADEVYDENGNLVEGGEA